jgi:uncharacterized protein (TIGR03032 family)
MDVRRPAVSEQSAATTPPSPSPAAGIGAPAKKTAYSFSASRQFPAWLAEQRLSVGLTTYQAGKLFLIGLQPNGTLSVFVRDFSRCMGLCVAGDTMWMSSLYQLWRFENTLDDGDRNAEGYDRHFVPRVGYVTGDLDIHDIAVDADGRVLFVNTLYSCLATTSERHSFQPLWHPPFVSKLAAEDRCHMNGLAMDDGRPRYVTAVSQADVADSWRDHRGDGGVVIDVASGEVAAAGRSMPHSPRLHRGTLWLLDSGTGFLGTVDPQSGRFEPVTFCPGYLRGLAFHGNFALVGLSGCREERTFSGLALDDNLAARKAEPRCGVMVIDLRSGDIVHWLRIEGAVRELYDVVVLPRVIRPMAIGFKTDEIRRTITMAPQATL